MVSYYLTRRAARDLKGIYEYSLEKWGSAVAKTYIKDIYIAFQKAAEAPEAGKIRSERSAPFWMLPAREHFIVFEPFRDGILVVTVLYQARNIESIIVSLDYAFMRELEALKARIPTHIPKG